MTRQQAAVPVCEYDKPVLDVLENPDLAGANPNCPGGIYSMIKSSQECIRAVFVARISVFSKFGYSMGLNSLISIRLSPRSASVCGYANHDPGTVFAPGHDGFPGTKSADVATAVTGPAKRGSTIHPRYCIDPLSMNLTPTAKLPLIT